MSKIFISYRFTGVPEEQLHQLLDPIMGSLRNLGYDPYCNLYDLNYYEENSMDTREIMLHCFEKLEELDNSGFHLLIFDTPELSQGMMIEMGYSLKKGTKTVVLYREGLSLGTTTSLANQSLSYTDLVDLKQKLQDVSV